MDGSCEPLWCADASSVACAQLLDLPDDALLAVLAYLQPTDLMMCRPVCRRLRDLCLQPALWRASRLKVRGEALMLAALRLAPCLAELDVSKGMEHAAAALASSPCKVARLRLGDDGSGEGYYAREVLQRVAALGGLQTLVIDFCSSALDEKHPLFKLVRDSVDASPCNGWEPPQSLLELVYYLDIRDLHLMCSAPLIDYPIAVRPGMETKPCLTTLHYLGFGSNQVDYFLDLLLKTHASTLTDVAVPPRYCSLSTLQSLTNLQSVSMDNWSYPTVADYYNVEGDDPGEDDAGEYGPGDDPVDDDAEDDPVEGDVGNDPVDDDVEDDPVDDDAANDPVVHDVGNDPVDDDAGDDAMDDAWDDPVNNEAEDAFAPGAEDFLGLVPDDDAGDLFPPGALEFLGLAPDLQYVSIRGFMDQESILTLTQSPCVGVLQELWLAIDPYFPWDLLSSSLHWFSSLQTLFVNVMPPEDFLRAVTPASAPCLRMLQLGDDELRIHDVLHEPAVKDLLERNSELHLHLGSAGRRVPSGCDCRWCLHKAQRGWKRCSTFASHSWAAECCGSHCFQWP